MSAPPTGDPLPHGGQTEALRIAGRVEPTPVVTHVEHDDICHAPCWAYGMFAWLVFFVVSHVGAVLFAGAAMLVTADDLLHPPIPRGQSRILNCRRASRDRLPRHAIVLRHPPAWTQSPRRGRTQAASFVRGAAIGAGFRRRAWGYSPLLVADNRSRKGRSWQTGRRQHRRLRTVPGQDEPTVTAPPRTGPAGRRSASHGGPVPTPSPSSRAGCSYLRGWASSSFK